MTDPKLAIHSLIATLCLCLSVSAWAGAGAETYNEYVEKELIYPDEEWQDYVTAVGERLVKAGGRSHQGHEFNFVVTDFANVNASAYADGFIFISRGILAMFRSEDELAGVLGHEIGHVVHRHVVKTQSRARVGQVLGWLGAFATGTTATRQLVNTVGGARLSAYGRENELQADEHGVKLLIAAGYSPRAMLDTIQMLSDHDAYRKAEGGAPTIYHGILSSHPAHQKRMHELIGQSQSLFPDELAEPVGDYYEMLQGLSYGDQSADGVIRDGVYYHGNLRLRIEFPKDWDVGSSPTEVYGRDHAQAGGTDAKVSVRRQSPPDEEQTPQEYLTETLRRDDLGEGQEIQVGPYPGYIADIELPGGGPLQSRKIAVVYKDGGVFLFEGELGANGSVETFGKQFEDTVMSFRAMTAADLRLINNQQLHIQVAVPGQTYEEIARASGTKNYGPQTLRVINGHYPNGEPRAGDYVKVIK